MDAEVDARRADDNREQRGARKKAGFDSPIRSGD